MLKLLYIMILLVYFTSKVHRQDERVTFIRNTYLKLNAQLYLYIYIYIYTHILCIQLLIYIVY